MECTEWKRNLLVIFFFSENSFKQSMSSGSNSPSRGRSLSMSEGNLLVTSPSSSVQKSRSTSRSRSNSPSNKKHTNMLKNISKDLIRKKMLLLVAMLSSHGYTIDMETPAKTKGSDGNLRAIELYRIKKIWKPNNELLIDLSRLPQPLQNQIDKFIMKKEQVRAKNGIDTRKEFKNRIITDFNMRISNNVMVDEISNTGMYECKVTGGKQTQLLSEVDEETVCMVKRKDIKSIVIQGEKVESREIVEYVIDDIISAIKECHKNVHCNEYFTIKPNYFDKIEDMYMRNKIKHDQQKEQGTYDSSKPLQKEKLLTEWDESQNELNGDSEDNPSFQLSNSYSSYSSSFSSYSASPALSDCSTPCSWNEKQMDTLDINVNQANNYIPQNCNDICNAMNMQKPRPTFFPLVSTSFPPRFNIINTDNDYPNSGSNFIMNQMPNPQVMMQPPLFNNTSQNGLNYINIYDPSNPANQNSFK